MIKQLPDVELPATRARRRRGAARRRASTTSSRRASGGSSPTTRSLATYLGIHTEDHRLGDAEPRRRARRDRRRPRAPRGGRGARRRRACRRRRGSSATSSSTTSGSALFDATRSGAGSGDRTAAGELGDARVPAVRARRGAARASGSSGSPTGSRRRRRSSSRSKTRATGPQVAVWQRTEARYAADLPALFAEVRAAADGVLDGPALARLDRVDRGRQRGARRRTPAG